MAPQAFVTAGLCVDGIQFCLVAVATSPRTHIPHAHNARRHSPPSVPVPVPRAHACRVPQRCSEIHSFGCGHRGARMWRSAVSLVFVLLVAQASLTQGDALHVRGPHALTIVLRACRHRCACLPIPQSAGVSAGHVQALRRLQQSLRSHRTRHMQVCRRSWALPTSQACQ